MNQAQARIQDPTPSILRRLAELLSEFADALDASPSARDSSTSAPDVPPVRGRRQQQIVELAGMRSTEGLRTYEIAVTIQYDQPNVWSTLQTLAGYGIVEQVPLSTPGPQRWRLTSKYR